MGWDMYVKFGYDFNPILLLFEVRGIFVPSSRGFNVGFFSGPGPAGERRCTTGDAGRSQCEA